MPRPVNRSQPATRPPYWLFGGTEVCSACSHGYVLQMEYRCWGCDQPFCEQCIVIRAGASAVLCTECGEESP